MDCADVRDDRMDALYGEAGDEALRRVAAHHAACPACRQEFDDLRSVRGRLAAWRLPARLEGQTPRRGVRPLAGLAAAAGLLLALGGALRLAGASLELGSGAVRLRLGPERASAALEEHDRRHQEELSALRESLAALRARPAASGNEEILDQVRALIRERDERLVQRLDAGLQGLASRADAQRRYDMARISAGLSYLDGKSGEHVARTSELMGYVLQASQGR